VFSKSDDTGLRKGLLYRVEVRVVARRRGAMLALSVASVAEDEQVTLRRA
jgi:hypothetical protein